ncbi:MAG TPA: molybdopterin cofactor-binding domain-containing protein, partial [Chloroflexota bacterium]|nr:molybdopterin cofactor-binding domain-containing protein [Chloroflexota bacterium]
ASLIQAEYAELPPVLDVEEAGRPAAARVHEAREGNVAASYTLRKGDVAAGFAQADGVLERVYTSPAVQHVSLEPHAVLARFEDGRLIVESATQTPHHVRRQLAEIFRLSLSHVRVLVPSLGGGFGGKCYPEIEPVAALLARKARRPVKIVLSRAEEFVTTARQACVVRIRSGFTRDGRLLAVEAEIAYQNGAYAETADRVIRHGARSLSAPYRVPHRRITASAYFTNTTPCGPFRAPGAGQAIWAMESHVDEVARELDLDPLEVRLKNLVRSGDSYVDGGLLEDIRYPEMLQEAARAVGWGEPRPSQPAGERIGRGLAVVMKTTNTPSTSTATVKLNEDGSLDVLTSSVEMGQGASTVLAQIAAQRAGVDVRKVHVSQVDTDTTPYDQSTSSSRTTFAMGRAITDAVNEVNRQLRELAGAQLEVGPADIDLGDGRASVRGVPDRSVEYGALVRAARRGNLLGTAVYTTTAKPDPATGEPGVSAHYHQAAGAAEVAVDPDTGRVRLLRLHHAVFAGRAINPTLCELQTEGSAFFGVGQALFEAIHLDGGQVSNANLGDYLIPAFGDLPRLTVARIHEEPGHEEVHGIGEVAAPIAPPAIANAIADAVGARVRDLPLAPERVLRALRGE